MARRPALSWRDYRDALSEVFVRVSLSLDARAEYRPSPHPTIAFNPSCHDSSGEIVLSVCHEIAHHIVGAGAKEPIIYSLAEEAAADILTHAPRLREAIKDRIIEACLLYMGGGMVREAGE